MRTLRLFLLCAPLLTAFLTGCGTTDPSSETLLTLYVGPATADCVGVGPQQCLLVKQSPEEEWKFFHDSIEGFSFEPGFTYTLRVARRRILDPPADGSSYAYRLIRVLARVPAAQP